VGSFCATAFRAAAAPVPILELRDAFEFIGSLPPMPGARRLRIDVLSNSTLQGLSEPLCFYLKLLGVEPELRFHAPYGIPSGMEAADVVLAVLDFEKFCRKGFEPDVEMVGSWLDAVRQQAPGCNLAVGEPIPLIGAPAVASNVDIENRTSFAGKLDATLKRAGASQVLWTSSLARLGWERARRAPAYYHYDQLLTQDGLCVIAEASARHVAALVRPRKKVVCLDADNTLWGGVVGEDGPDGIVFRPDTPKGRCFHSVHRQLLRLSREGVLLALSSRNDEASVLAVLDRPEFPLKRSDFAALRINWGTKSKAIREMAAELNLGLDSFVFIDDSPTERAEVAAALPDVEVVPVPEKTELYPQVLGRIAGLDRLSVTKEDTERREEYSRQAQRRQVLAEEPASYLEKLKITLDIAPASQTEIPRVAQLLAKTNQFRLGPWSPAEPELRCLSADPASLVLRLCYADAFGDSGLVGAALLSRSDRGWKLAQVVLSCRVLGRGVEERFLWHLTEKFAPLSVSFERTGRNTVAEQALGRLGWPDLTLNSKPQGLEKIKLNSNLP
jgi:FkbH-like protein